MTEKQLEVITKLLGTWEVLAIVKSDLPEFIILTCADKHEIDVHVTGSINLYKVGGDDDGQDLLLDTTEYDEVFSVGLNND